MSTSNSKNCRSNDLCGKNWLSVMQVSSYRPVAMFQYRVFLLQNSWLSSSMTKLSSKLLWQKLQERKDNDVTLAWDALEMTVENADFARINLNLVDQEKRNSVVKNGDVLILFQGVSQ